MAEEECFYTVGLVRYLPYGLYPHRQGSGHGSRGGSGSRGPEASTSFLSFKSRSEKSPSSTSPQLPARPAVPRPISIPRNKIVPGSNGALRFRTIQFPARASFLPCTAALVGVKEANLAVSWLRFSVLIFKGGANPRFLLESGGCGSQICKDGGGYPREKAPSPRRLGFVVPSRR
ncbi:hypothetical protein BS78_04G241300 [Paspalum vaginatum]|nr:hypothetical protein BS78_04G241300 [Paspalum vaginatum]